MNGVGSFGDFTVTCYALVYHFLFAILVYNWDAAYTPIWIASFSLVILFIYLQGILDPSSNTYGNTFYE